MAPITPRALFCPAISADEHDRNCTHKAALFLQRLSASFVACPAIPGPPDYTSRSSKDWLYWLTCLQSSCEDQRTDGIAFPISLIFSFFFSWPDSFWRVTPFSAERVSLRGNVARAPPLLFRSLSPGVNASATARPANDTMLPFTTTCLFSSHL